MRLRIGVKTLWRRSRTSDARNEGISRTVEGMAELELRFPILHPEARYLEVTIGLRRIRLYGIASLNVANVIMLPIPMLPIVNFPSALSH